MGDKLRQHIKAADITQADLANKVGISTAMVSAIINGVRQPSVMVLKRMAEILGCQMEDLI